MTSETSLPGWLPYLEFSLSFKTHAYMMENVLLFNKPFQSTFVLSERSFVSFVDIRNPIEGSRGKSEA